ncbi:MAG: antitoxin [Desulfobacteraceae bacterium IS3]|nr:MAG: antitoxin [Desulfobacteraceae bacterium IS3]
MRRITASDILALSIPERILLVEEIWDTIAAKADVIDITDEEKRIIDQRLQAYYRNPNAASSWEDVYNRIVSE